MYAKIHRPKTEGKSVYDNKGSAGRTVNYLRSEELKEDPNTFISYQTDKGKMNYGEAIQNIDNNSKGIEVGKVKFTSLSFNFSKEEAQALDKGKKGDTRTKEERVGEFTKKLMDGYAKSFPSKKLTEQDLVYVAKVHEHRKKNGELDKDGQTHFHVVVSNLTKDGQYINPETKHRSHFNKSKYFNSSQKITSEELGTEMAQIRTLNTNFNKENTKNHQAIHNQMKGKAYYAVHRQEAMGGEETAEILAANVKGLAKDANKITVIEIQPKKGNYFNNPENARKSADKVMENYTKSLKRQEVKKEELLYFYRVDKEAKNPSLEIVVSNRNKGMDKSVGANSKSFDFKKFDSLNNKFHNELVKERNHISPTQKNVYVLNKKYDAGINYKETFKNEWLGKDSKAYKDTKQMLDDKFKNGLKMSEEPSNFKVNIGRLNGIKKLFKSEKGVDRDDMEIHKTIEKRKRQDQGLKRERRKE